MDFEARCEEVVGKTVRITFKDGSVPMVGECYGYTRAIDNDPEIAEIDILRGGLLYGLEEPDIASIEEVRSTK